MKRSIITIIILVSLFSFNRESFSQYTINITPQDIGGWIDDEFNKGLETYNIPGATFVLIQGDSIRHINAYGVSDIETKTPVNFETSIFRIGSISKTFVATAAMQLWEKGKLNLDTDINNYLKTFQIDYKFNDSITVKHLLTHTAGFDSRNIGWIVKSQEEVIPLAQYLKKRMPPQIRPAGTCISYTNHAYGLLALVVEQVSGLPFDTYVTQNILKPLEMNSSGFKKLLELEKNYVSSYLPDNEQLIPFEPVFMLNYPTGSFSSTAPDMGNYISMFLNYGNYNGVQVLDSTTVIKMHQTAFKNYEEAENGWLLGFHEFQRNGFQIVRHMGMYQGFTSDLIIIPELNTGFFFSLNASSMLNSPSHTFIHSFVNQLLIKLVPENKEENKYTLESVNTGKLDKPLETFSGIYRISLYPHKTLDKIAILMGFTYEIEIASNDSALEIKEWNHILNPVAGLTFNSSFGGNVAFAENAKGEIFYYFDNTATYERLKWYEPVRFQLYWICSILIILLVYVIAKVTDRFYFGNKHNHPIKKMTFLLASFVIIFLLMLALIIIFTEPSALFFFGIPFLLKITLVLPLLILTSAFIALFLLIKAFWYKELGNISLIFQSVAIAAAMAFIPWLIYYNLIGFHY